MRVMKDRYIRAVIKPKKSKTFKSPDGNKLVLVNPNLKDYLSVVVDRESLKLIMYCHFKKVFGEQLVLEAWSVSE